MKNNNQGVTLINLVILISAMLILISITGYYSIDNVRNSYIARQKREMSNVVDYVSVLRAKLLIGKFEIPEELTPISADVLVSVAKSLSNTAITSIEEVNASSSLDKMYKYYYLTPEKLSDKRYSDGDVSVKSAKSNYIVNYYTGTVIAFYDENNFDISGSIKGLDAILNELY